MKKVIIFGTDHGAEQFAKLLQNEVHVINVETRIDWGHDYSSMTRLHVRNIVEVFLDKYIGHVDLIVIASYSLTETCLDFLREKHPEQKFIGFTPHLARSIRQRITDADLPHELRAYKNQLNLKQRIRFVFKGYEMLVMTDIIKKMFIKSKREVVVILASDKVRKSRPYFEDKKTFFPANVIEPRYGNWSQKFEFSDHLEYTLYRIAMNYNVKSVIIYETAFAHMSDTFKQLYGNKVKIYNGFDRGISDVKRMLGMCVV
ncbi:MAG: hypothetical protein Q4E47_02985 [Candidatus Saccharibacteria bacterium]|nr:hypothetical protein [Candidatus Saccharibacteria bacterium]